MENTHRRPTLKRQKVTHCAGRRSIHPIIANDAA